MSGGTVNFTAVMPDDLRVETARHEEGHLWVLLAGGRTTVQVEVTDDQARSLAQAILAALPPQPYQAEAMAVSEDGPVACGRWIEGTPDGSGIACGRPFDHDGDCVADLCYQEAGDGWGCVLAAGHEGAHASALSDVYGEDVAKCGPCADGQPCPDHAEAEYAGTGGEQ